MGFDLHGLNPIINEAAPKILSKFYNKDGWNNWEKMNKHDKNVYFAADAEHHKNNPGLYFRNNVWWWRPLWCFVSASCSDILTDGDIESGSFNDGHEISKTKAMRIGARLRKMIKSGAVKEYEEQIMPGIEAAKKNNEKVELELSVLKEKVRMNCPNLDGTTEKRYLAPINYPEPYHSEYEKIYSKKNWDASYPFDVDNVKNFADFCVQSGGFSIS